MVDKISGILVNVVVVVYDMLYNWEIWVLIVINIVFVIFVMVIINMSD